MIYLDYASTYPVETEVLDAYHSMSKAYFYNQEALYQSAVKLNELYEQSKRAILTRLQLDQYQVIHTSGASEANNLAIKGYARQYQTRGRHLITTLVEHPSVLESFKQLEQEGFEVTYLGVNAQGQIDLKQLKEAITDQTILVSIMAINNETGVIMPIKEIASLIKRYPKISFHCDAVQALAKCALPYQLLDLIVLSAHKIGGLKGSGVLIKKNAIKLQSQIVGGSQEAGFRAGTTDTVKQILFAKTLRLAMSKDDHHVISLNQLLREELEKINDLVIHSPSNASPYILSFSCLGFRSEIILNGLSEQGIAISSRATCSNKKNEPSHVLSAMGLSEQAMTGALRVSLSHLSNETEIKVFIENLKQLLSVLKKEDVS